MDLLRHLRFFVTVAETRHFGNAAGHLGMTQPPLSQGVARLERQLGVRLFDRDARGVRITAAGAALLPGAADLLAAAEVLLAAASRHVEPDALRFGVVPELEERVAEVVGALAAHSTVLPRVLPSVELSDLVADGELDLAVVRHPGLVDGSVAGEVVELRTRLETPPAMKSRGAVRLAEVRLPIATAPRRHHPAAHDQLVDTLRRHGHSGATVEAPDPVTGQALVAAGRAVRLRRNGVGILGNPLPLRVRVLYPAHPLRRRDLPYDALVDRVEAALR